MNEREKVPMKLTRETMLDQLLTAMNRPEFADNFPLVMRDQVRRLGVTAATQPNSTVRAMLDGLADGLLKEIEKAGEPFNAVFDRAEPQSGPVEHPEDLLAQLTKGIP